MNKCKKKEVINFKHWLAGQGVNTAEFQSEVVCEYGSTIALSNKRKEEWVIGALDWDLSSLDQRYEEVLAISNDWEHVVGSGSEIIFGFCSN